MEEKNNPNPLIRIDPKTGRPLGAVNPKATTTITIPAHQSSIIIPKEEILALKLMNRHDKRKWGARKKQLLCSVIDEYIRQAVVSTNGNP